MKLIKLLNKGLPYWISWRRNSYLFWTIDKDTKGLFGPNVSNSDTG
jgi:hypothetical protein